MEGNADEGWVITCDNRRQWHPREWTFGILKGMDAEFLENMTEAVRECASGGTPIGCDSGCEHEDFVKGSWSRLGFRDLQPRSMD